MRAKGLNGALLSTLMIASIIALTISILYPSPVRAALTPHDWIYIVGNDNFILANGVTSGSGTAEDPYIIENWNIGPPAPVGIHIRNTNAYFIIRNCYVHNIWGQGILLDNVGNGKIDNVRSKNNDGGIYLYSSTNNIILNSTSENDSPVGPAGGIYLGASSNNNIENCTAWNDQYGIYLSSSENNLVLNNIVGNNAYGIYLRNSDNNLLSNNLVEKNLWYGFWLEHSNNNRVYHNNILNNENQAYDNGSNYWDDGYSSGGNYWSDHTGVDRYRGEDQDFPGGDGISDFLYDIPGDNNRDRYPLTLLSPKSTSPVLISPDYQEGLQGGKLNYLVEVGNPGSLPDNYTLTANDSVGWELALSKNRLENVQPNEVRKIGLSIKIPDDAVICVDNDNILVTAISERFENWDNYWCIAHAAKRIGPASEDSTTRQYLENSVWGGYPTIWVGRYLDCSQRGWLKFDLSAIPSIENIARAKLWLYCYRAENVEAIVKCHRVDNDDWSETTINWVNKPPIGGILDTRAVYEGGGWYYWDVADFVRKQFAVDNLASFCLVDLGENISPDHAARFSSKEYTDNWPYLEILATVPDTDVRALAKPIFQGGLVGSTLTYTITVVNKGDSDDNFYLFLEETEAWGSYLSDAELSNIASGDNSTTTLNVPVGGSVCNTNNITITVTSQENSEIYDKIVCSAHRSKATFVNYNISPGKLRTKYEVWVDLNVLLRDDASELVLKFYDWGGGYQGENIVSTTMPARLETLWKNHHPVDFHEAVKKVELVLEDAQGTEIQTITTFTVTKTILELRFAEIPLHWLLNLPPGKLELEIEFSSIPLNWLLAPS